MMLNDQYQSYAQGCPVTLTGSFQTNGAGAPTIIRDGHCTLITSVTRTGAGTYVVALEQCPLPERPFATLVSIGPASVTPTKGLAAGVVDSTYNSSTRSFTILTYVPGATATLSDPDVGARVSFTIVGSIVSAGTDVA